MRILITGASGHIGSYALPQLRRRGHQVRCLARDTPATRGRIRALGRDVEVAWGDLRDPVAVRAATVGIDAVLHLGYVIPPRSEEQPGPARETNVTGTRNVIEACLAAPRPPRLLFTSTFDVHGHTLDREPPRHVDDPLEATDNYTAHKIECEEMVTGSGLDWCILRLVDVPILGARDPHPIMFDIGPDNRIEAVHAEDAAVALAAAFETPQVWGRTLFVGGGASCQLTYREYLTRLLAAMGIAPLPDEAFSTKVYATDWVDSTESEALWHYQRHSFDDIAAAVAASLGWKRRLMPLAAPVARAAILRMSPYYGNRTVNGSGTGDGDHGGTGDGTGDGGTAPAGRA